VFGLDDTTAIRYATAARQLLDTTAERAPRVHREPKDQNRSPAANTPEFPPMIPQSG
jgi:hypothetical protein